MPRTVLVTLMLVALAGAPLAAAGHGGPDPNEVQDLAIDTAESTLRLVYGTQVCTPEGEVCVSGTQVCLSDGTCIVYEKVCLPDGTCVIVPIICEYGLPCPWIVADLWDCVNGYGCGRFKVMINH